MTREEIIELASQAGFLQNWINHGHAVQYLEKFAALVAAAERERCAKVCDLEASEWGTNQDGWYACRNVAAAIRELK